MNKIAQALSDEEITQAAEWFAKLPPVAGWTKVTEASTVAKTFVGGGRMRYASPEGGTEPLGNRIITLPADQSRVTKRDPHSGFVAYVPVGSIKRGEVLVTTGGSKTLPCTYCHGADLRGLGPVPGLANRSPSYLARQIYDFQQGTRAGTWSALMKPVVEKLTVADMVDIFAYTASRQP